MCKTAQNLKSFDFLYWFQKDQVCQEKAFSRERLP